MRDQIGQFLTAVDLFDSSISSNGSPIDKHGEGGSAVATTFFVVNDRLRDIGSSPFTSKVSIAQDGAHSALIAAVTDSPCIGLAEEGIHFPVFLLTPFIEWVVVTLRALNLKSHENLRDRGGRLRRLFFVDLVDQKIGRAVEIFSARFGIAFGGNQFVHHAIVRLVSGKGIAEILLHPFATDHGIVVVTTGTADQDVRPNRRPVSSILFHISLVIKQLVDEFLPLVSRL